jgi:hypothetical protein
MVFSVSLVALAGLVFVATHGDDDTSDTANPAASTHQPVTGATEPPVITPTATPKAPPVIRRGRVNVVVFNNTNTKGLAGKTATRASRAGWNVVTTDNWHGSVDASTVYFPARMKPAAQLLAADLGIKRVKPSFAPMKGGQLTVILTTDYR